MAQKLNQDCGAKIEPPKTGKRYGKSPKEVLEDKELSASARVIFGWLAMHVFQGKTCTVGQRRIGEQLGFARNTVISGLRELKKRGHLDIIQRGKGRSRYVLHSMAFGQKQGKEDVIVSGPRGRRLVSVDLERTA